MSGENQKTILPVEDEAVIAMGEKISLEDYGYKVIIANTAEEAVETVKKMPGIDLVLMDINLGIGKMDGTEAAEIILRERDLRRVWITACGHADGSVRRNHPDRTGEGSAVRPGIRRMRHRRRHQGTSEGPPPSHF